MPQDKKEEFVQIQLSSLQVDVKLVLQSDQLSFSICTDDVLTCDFDMATPVC